MTKVFLEKIFEREKVIKSQLALVPSNVHNVCFVRTALEIYNFGG